jgi:hypothetical protein
MIFCTCDSPVSGNFVGGLRSPDPPVRCRPSSSLDVANTASGLHASVSSRSLIDYEVMLQDTENKI